MSVEISWCKIIQAIFFITWWQNTLVTFFMVTQTFCLHLLNWQIICKFIPKRWNLIYSVLLGGDQVSFLTLVTISSLIVNCSENYWVGEDPLASVGLSTEMPYASIFLIYIFRYSMACSQLMNNQSLSIGTLMVVFLLALKTKGLTIFHMYLVTLKTLSPLWPVWRLHLRFAYLCIEKSIRS